MLRMFFGYNSDCFLELISRQVVEINDMLLAIASVRERARAELATNQQIPSDLRVDLHENHSAIASPRWVLGVVAERSSLSSLTAIIVQVLGPCVLNAVLVFSADLSVLLQVSSILEQTVRSGRRARHRVRSRSIARCRYGRRRWRREQRTGSCEQLPRIDSLIEALNRWNRKEICYRLDSN